jgi:hypothetical protein
MACSRVSFCDATFPGVRVRKFLANRRFSPHPSEAEQLIAPFRRVCLKRLLGAFP